MAITNPIAFSLQYRCPGSNQMIPCQLARICYYTIIDNCFKTQQSLAIQPLDLTIERDMVPLSIIVFNSQMDV